MDLVCLGEALIDFVSVESGVSVGESSGFLKSPGGAPANVAVGAAKLGMRSAFLGKVGDDPFGIYLRDTFAKHGVDVSGMRLDPDHRTGLAFVSLQNNGERSFCFFRNPSADMMYHPADVDNEIIRRAKIFHFGSISMIEEPGYSATLAAVETARQAGLLISYDPNLRPLLWPDLNRAQLNILQTISTTQILKISDEELAFLFGDVTPQNGLNLIMGRYPNLLLAVITLGENGCVWATKDGKRGSECGNRVDSIDTTGAGDGFVAGLLTQLVAYHTEPEHMLSLDAAELKRIFAFACGVGAMCTTIRGAIPSMPTLDQVEQFLSLQMIPNHR